MEIQNKTKNNVDADQFAYTVGHKKNCHCYKVHKASLFCHQTEKPVEFPVPFSLQRNGPKAEKIRPSVDACLLCALLSCF